MGIVIALALFGALFVSDNQEFFDTAAKQIDKGATWHYVGKQPLDPTTKSIPGRICEPDTGKCGEPFIIWKLKKPE